MNALIRNRRVVSLALIGSLCAAPQALAATHAFGAGSIIIPGNQEYQSDTGMVSAYGLIYTLLLKNKNLARPITVYWVLESRKLSHHRCNTLTTNVPSYATYNEDDGCDLAIVAPPGQQPVYELNGSFTQVTGANFKVWTTTYNNQGVVSRSGGQVAVATTVKYSGSFFAIDASDVGSFLSQMNTDPDLQQFHQSGACDSSLGGCGSGGASCHYVHMHQANYAFNAPVSRTMNTKPPLIALVGATYVGILQSYLQNAGLNNLAGAAGTICPANNVNCGNHGVVYDVLNAVTDFTSTSPGCASAGQIASAASGATGAVFPCAAEDYGPLNYPDPSNPSQTFYQVVWAPHWEVAGGGTGAQDFSPPNDCDPGDDVCGDNVWTHGALSADQNAMANIAQFGDNGNGIFGECAAIGSFDGSYAQGATPTCTGSTVCSCNDPLGLPCPFGLSTPPSGCPVGFTATTDINGIQCGTCAQCQVGYNLNSSNCNAIECDAVPPCPANTTEYNNCSSPQCISTPGGPGGCPSPSEFMDLSSCTSPQCRIVNNPVGCSGSACRRDRATTRALTIQPPSTGTLTTQPAACPGLPGEYTPTCAATPPQVDLSGYGFSQLWAPLGPPATNNQVGSNFMTTDRLIINGLSDNYQAPDCTDSAVPVASKYYVNYGTGDCLDFHPTTGGPGNIFSQIGDFSYSGTSGHIKQFQPPHNIFPNPSYYQFGTSEFITSRNAGNANNAGWDFVNTRHKDGNAQKGMVVYLAGHQYCSNVGGNRIVLNTLLNLGFALTGNEIARSSPVGYLDNNDATTKVFQGTVSLVPPPPGQFADWQVFNPNDPQSFRFPYTPGHFYQYKESSIATSLQAFKTNSTWDANSVMPAPGNRQVFTYLGGSANLGWHRVNWSYKQTDQTLGVSVNANANGQPCLDANNNGLCDLAEAFIGCLPGITAAGLNTAPGANNSQTQTVDQFVQEVLGYCAATNGSPGPVIPQPTAAQCTDPTQQNNKAVLGGIDHGSSAVVGASKYLAAPSPYAGRPTVAYVGGDDGMLHAFWVSGGLGFTADGVSMPGALAPGQELWAMIPPGQICGLPTNSSTVDASVNVIDAFGNFPVDANHDGVIDWTNPAERPTGLRSWRTVLVGATGSGGAQMFALDVTNPLLPILLWYIDGTKDTNDKWDSNGDGIFQPLELSSVQSGGSGMDKTKVGTYANKWFNWDDGNPGTDYIPTPYNTITPTILDEIKFGRYNYSDLGNTYGIDVATTWAGTSLSYVAFVVSAAPPSPHQPGAEVFAVDVVTGQKLWQWEQQYMITNGTGIPIADDSIPGRPGLVDTNYDGAVDRLYVGDLEGHLWELGTPDGRNVNYVPDTSATFHSFPLMGTAQMTPSGVPAIDNNFIIAGGGMAQMPLTSPIGLGRLTANGVPAGQPFTPWVTGRIDVVQGTQGVDWTIDPSENAHVEVMPAYLDTGTRVTAPINMGVNSPLTKGLLNSSALWDIVLGPGERVYGQPTIAGDSLLVATSTGNFNGDITSSLTDVGYVHSYSASGAVVLATTVKTMGSPVVIGDDIVIAAASGMQRIGQAAGTYTGIGKGAKLFNRASPVSLKTYETPYFYKPPYWP